MDELEKLRREIDQIDMEIISLLKKRLEIVREIAEIKKSKNIPIYNAEREEVVLKRSGDFKEIFKEILRHSKSYQQRIISNNPLKIGGTLGIVGYGRMGRLFSRILSNAFDKIAVYDIDPPNSIGDNVMTCKNLKEVIEISKWIIVSTPLNVIHKTLQKIRELSLNLDVEDKLLIEIASIKYHVIPELLKMPRKMKVASIHPMFGPNIESHLGEKILIIDISDRIDGSKEVEKVFKSLGFQVYRIDPYEHDRGIVYTIGLPYLIGYAYSRTVEDLKEKTELLGGPSYKLFTSYYKKIKGDGVEFIDTIFQFEDGPRILNRFISELRKLIGE